MSKKNIALIGIVGILGALYLFNFTGVFQKPGIEISSRVRPQVSRRGKSPAGNSISFSLSGKYGLTSLKVVEENDFKTNKYPHALWHLLSESNSVPTKSIIYGAPVQGMKPEYAKTRAEPLQPGDSYVLLLEAGKIKGQITFRAP